MPPLLRVLPSLWQKLRPQTVMSLMYARTTPWGIPFYGYVYWGTDYLHRWPVFLGGTALFASLSVVCVAGATRLTELTIRWYPEPQQAGRRVGLNLLLLMLFIVVGTRITMALMDAVHLFGYVYQPARDRWALVSVALIYVIIGAIAEAVYVISQWQNTQLETQHLENQRAQAQLDEVKQQVNPHFLFNSLNSLSVLIGESPPQAERFVDEMASVYRYLLQAHRPGHVPSQVDLTTLGDELDFLRSYVYLLATRYGRGLDVVIHEAPGQHGGGLLPLTLQTLVDNAIRHNVVAPDTPLRIDINTTPAGQVQVRNTLQKRSVRVPVNRESLATLQARYRLLGSAGMVHVETTPQHFTVSVQLVQS